MLYLLKLMYAELVKINSTFYRDPRTVHLPLVGSPVPMGCILLLYVLFVKKWGPALMAKRSPIDVKLPMQIYNVLQVLLNLYVCVGAIRYSYARPEFRLLCQPYNTQDTSEHLMNLRYPAIVYYATKYMDLLDTIFFVLRKKDRQISFLHVYHHTMMVYAVWTYMTLQFGSQFTGTGVLNSFIHVLMYSYYFLAAAKPSFNLSPWKRVLTTMQIVQFCCLTLLFSFPIIRNTCQLDMFWCWLCFIQNLFLLVLFLDFYVKTYIKKPQAKVETTNGKVVKSN